MYHRRSLTILLPVALACFALLFTYVASHAQDQPEVELHEGLVQPSRNVLLRAPVDGRVAKLDISEGHRVSEGDLLLEMDGQVQEAVVERAKLRAEDQSPVLFAELALNEANLRLTEIERAFAGEAANELEVLSARVARDQAKVRVDAAKESLAQAQVELILEQRRLREHKVYAPFDGVVVEVQSDIGASLTREEPIIELVNLDSLEAEVFLPDRLFGQLTLGQTYQLRAGHPVDSVLEAKLDRIIPLIDPGSRTFRVVLTIPNPESKLPSGFTVMMELPVESE